MDNHSSGTNVTVCLKRPTRIPHGPRAMTLRSRGFLFGLAPSGVFPATPVARRAVRSYRTISPLPINGRYIFCGTFRRLTPPRRYLALCPVEPGLSSLCCCKERLPDRLREESYQSVFQKTIEQEDKFRKQRRLRVNIREKNIFSAYQRRFTTR